MQTLYSYADSKLDSVIDELYTVFEIHDAHEIDDIILEIIKELEGYKRIRDALRKARNSGLRDVEAFIDNLQEDFDEWDGMLYDLDVEITKFFTDKNEGKKAEENVLMTAKVVIQEIRRGILRKVREINDRL